MGQGENMYMCEKCHQKVPATTQFKIERPPQVLCIQLKRFNMMGGKDGRPVTLARKLNISNHVRWANQKQIPVEYKLVSMINHVGASPNSGHYTSIAEGANGTFYRFDDASVIPTSLQNALNTSAYIIFYEMLKTSRNQILSVGNIGSKSKPDPSPAKNPDRKLIGPQLPSPSPTIAKISPSPRTIPSNSIKQSQSPLVKPRPKLITESSPNLLKPKKKCKVMPIKPYKEPPKPAEELEQKKVQYEKIDSMLSVPDSLSISSNIVECDHPKHVFTDTDSDNCEKTEKLLQLRVALVNFFPEGSLFKPGPKPRKFSKMMYENWKQHYPGESQDDLTVIYHSLYLFLDSLENTHSLSIKLGHYDRCHLQNKPVSKSGRIKWSKKMIEDVKISRDAALSKLAKEAEDEMMKPRSLTSYWKQEWHRLYPELDINFKRVETR